MPKNYTITEILTALIWNTFSESIYLNSGIIISFLEYVFTKKNQEHSYTHWDIDELIWNTISEST